MMESGYSGEFMESNAPAKQKKKNATFAKCVTCGGDNFVPMCADCFSERKLEAAIHEQETRDMLLSCLYQFASYSDQEGRTSYSPMGLSTLEDLFAFFGLDRRVYTEEELNAALGDNK